MPSLNRKDRQELQDIVEARINAKRDKIMKTYTKPQDVFETALHSLGLYDTWAKVVATQATLQKAHTNFDLEVHKAVKILELQEYKPRHDTDSIQYYINREAERITKNDFENTEQAEQIKTLENQGRKLKTELLYATLPDEFKAIMQSLDALVGEE